VVNATATVFTVDIYQRWLRPKATEANLVSVGRCAGLLTLIVAAPLTFVAMRYRYIFIYSQNASCILAGSAANPSGRNDGTWWMRSLALLAQRCHHAAIQSKDRAVVVDGRTSKLLEFRQFLGAEKGGAPRRSSLVNVVQKLEGLIALLF